MTHTAHVDISDRIRIDLGGGQTLTVAARDVVDFVRHCNKPRKKSCPNPECPGGWMPDVLKSGKRKCPVCKTEWSE